MRQLKSIFSLRLTQTKIILMHASNWPTCMRRPGKRKKLLSWQPRQWLSEKPEIKVLR
jgi:hypothetical protein